MRNFSDILREVRGGKADDELGDHLRELCEAVAATNKGGALTLTLTIKPNGPNAVLVEDAVKMKAPEAAASATLFFVDEDHNLTRRDPRQLTLSELREVEDAIR
jgi:hypothetical protein